MPCSGRRAAPASKPPQIRKVERPRRRECAAVARHQVAAARPRAAPCGALREGMAGSARGYASCSPLLWWPLQVRRRLSTEGRRRLAPLRRHFVCVLHGHGGGAGRGEGGGVRLKGACCRLETRAHSLIRARPFFPFAGGQTSSLDVTIAVTAPTCAPRVSECGGACGWMAQLTTAGPGATPRHTHA